RLRRRSGRQDALQLGDPGKRGLEAHHPVIGTCAARLTTAGGHEWPPAAIRPSVGLCMWALCDYCRSASTPCGAWLACASMLVPACCRIESFVKLTISLA